MTQAYSKKEIPVLLSGVEPKLDLLITSLGALPRSYRRLKGAKTIKLARFMGQTFCILLGWNVNVCHMHNGINVMEYILSLVNI